MAVLSRKRRSGPSDGHIFDRIKETSWGSHRGRINKKQEVFHNDYVYVYDEKDDESVEDLDIGINKNYIRAHDADYCNNLKNDCFAINRYMDTMEHSEDIDELLGVIEDGLEDIQDLLNEFGEGTDE